MSAAALQIRRIGLGALALALGGLLNLAVAAQAPRKLASTSVKAAENSSLCYSFVRDDARIWVSCHGSVQPVTHKRYWADYAIDSLGAHVAARGGPWALHGAEHEFAHDVLLISLATGAVGRRPAPGYYIPTCGTIVVLGREMSDLITGRAMHADGYGNNFRCDESRSVTIGTKLAKDPGPPPGALALWLGAPPATLLSSSVNAMYNAVSPDGRYTAWQTIDGMCVEGPGAAAPSCTPSDGDGLVTVSNRGEILWDDAPSPYETVIYYWKPGLAKRVKLCGNDCGQPEWISPTTAKALIAGYKANRWPMF